MQQFKQGTITVIQDKFGSDQTVNIEGGKFHLINAPATQDGDRENLEVELLESGDIEIRITYQEPYDTYNAVDGTEYQKFYNAANTTIRIEKWAARRLAEWLGVEEEDHE